MRVLITGTAQVLGSAVADHLEHEVLGCLHGYDGRPLDQVDAVLHLAPFDSPIGDDAVALEESTLGTYKLMSSARDAGVERVVLASSLAVYDTYPEAFMVDEMWRPIAPTEPIALGAFLAESCAREFVREGGIHGIALRFLPIGDDRETNTQLADALHAIDCALTCRFEPNRYRWHVCNIAASSRFILRDARNYLNFERQGHA